MTPFQQRVAELLSVGPRLIEAPQSIEAPADAAVALIFVPDPDAILLIRRAEREGDPWSGQMAFPGGRRHREDPDLLATAIRETREEVDLDLSTARLLGTLPDVAPRSLLPPPMMVRPHVFALDRLPPLHPNAEVAAVRWVPVARLRDPAVHRGVALRVRGELREFPAYILDDDVVWGMTERVLTPLLQAVGRSE